MKTKPAQFNPFHIYKTRCPDETNPNQRDPNCQACQALNYYKKIWQQEQLKKTIIEKKEIIIKSTRSEILNLFGWSIPKLLNACKLLGYPDFKSYQQDLRLNYILNHPNLTAQATAQVFNCTRRTVTELRRLVRGRK